MQHDDNAFPNLGSLGSWATILTEVYNPPDTGDCICKPRVICIYIRKFVCIV